MDFENDVELVRKIFAGGEYDSSSRRFGRSNAVYVFKNAWLRILQIYSGLAKRPELSH